MDYISLLALTALFLALTTLACHNSKPFAYKVKFAFIYSYVVFVMGMGTWIFRSLGHNIRETTTFCVNSIRPVFQVLGLTLKVSGQEVIEDNTAYVILLNHQHTVDSLVINQLLPILNYPRIVMKEELQRYGPVGKAFEGINAIFVKRGSGREAIKSLIEATATAKSESQGVVFFPEGTRHMGPDLLPFKLGAFYAAVNAKVPILPVVVKPYQFLDVKNKRFDSPGTIQVQVLDPVSTQDLDDNDVSALAEKCRTLMSNAFRGKEI